ncbi:hypothetical protein [Zooshikella ganghwensis]|nr:hypothetical protein [Zooshikella ganghwensis]
MKVKLMQFDFSQLKKQSLSYIACIILCSEINIIYAKEGEVAEQKIQSAVAENYCKQAMSNMKRFMPNILKKAKLRAAEQGVDLTKDKQVQQLTQAINNTNELNNLILDCQMRWEKYQASAICMSGAESESDFALCIPKLPE